LGGRALSSPAENSHALSSPAESSHALWSQGESSHSLWSQDESSHSLSSLAENVGMAIVKPLSTGQLVIHRLPAGHPFGA
jgi:hypothetical protein